MLYDIAHFIVLLYSVLIFMMFFSVADWFFSAILFFIVFRDFIVCSTLVLSIFPLFPAWHCSVLLLCIGSFMLLF